jgi:hypothetical protein
MFAIRDNQRFRSGVKTFTLIIGLLLTPVISNGQQKTTLGLHFDPVISWFSSDIRQIYNEGARPGFNFGLSVNRYFADNYSFSTGLSILSAGGRLIGSDTAYLELTNLIAKVSPGKPIVYKIKYITIPIGLKMETNQIGYFTFFADLGVDPKVVIGRRADIRSLDITNEKANKELKLFNMSYHIAAGIEYSLGGNTALIFGLHFDNSFLDITRDNGAQPVDKITQKILSFRMGVNF